MYRLDSQQLAWRVAQDIKDGSFIYLDAGLPRHVQQYLSPQHNLISNPDAADIIVLGAEQVAANGDYVGATLPTHAASLYVMMELFAPNGVSRLVETLGLAPSGNGVTRIYTDLALFELCDGHVLLRELCEGLTLYSLQAELDVELEVPPGLRLFQIPPLA